uniref:Uncharacterized protein n=1 Tax=Rhizophora mucronata TaxID=61149 RepID=A0A2P2Q255_RHIMU
MGLQFTMTGW